MNRVYTLQVDLFHLTDTRGSYGPENRTKLRTVSFGVITDDEVSLYKNPSFMAKVEPLFPLQMYDEKLSYRQILCLNHDKLRNQRTTDDYPFQFLQLRYSDSLQKYIDNTHEKQVPNTDQFFPMTGKSFVSVQRRQDIESQNPYVYGQYRLEESFGCEHIPTNATIKCTDCQNSYRCVMCHDDAEMHPFSFSTLTCSFCDHQQSYAEHCTNCSQKLTNHMCDICHILDMNDPEYAPYFHCSICAKCHIKQLPDISQHCTTCGTCHSLQDFGDHYCSTEPEFCPVCQGVISACQDLKRLKCSSRHTLHMSCFEKLVTQHTVGCPLCRKMMIDEDQLVEWKMRLVQWMLVGKFSSRANLLISYSCNDCGCGSVDFVAGYCHACEGLNLALAAQVELTPGQLKAILAGTSEPYAKLCQQIEKYNELYAKIIAKKQSCSFFLQGGEGDFVGNNILEMIEEAFEGFSEE
ncbi:CHY zinc finger domain-containing protein [Spironucleus salmonicida]|uniref:CHY zinc finger domain-containing protein n=1 Tax=Spironucleus salmonicida TaxID=348837 RepID=V6LI21_9EUKA|nr:CHY zinc finger domain-containing protein [Spironucleus salmonicida]|eukprot:EST44182.1 CHY zinc finger domain-containing protein [Spironucleus salmonicida]